MICNHGKKILSHRFWPWLSSYFTYRQVFTGNSKSTILTKNPRQIAFWLPTTWRILIVQLPINFYEKPFPLENIPCKKTTARYLYLIISTRTRESTTFGADVFIRRSYGNFLIALSTTLARKQKISADKIFFRRAPGLQQNCVTVHFNGFVLKNSLIWLLYCSFGEWRSRENIIAQILPRRRI